MPLNPQSLAQLAQLLKTGAISPQSNPVESAMDNPVQRPQSYYTSSNPQDLAEQRATHQDVEEADQRDMGRVEATRNAQLTAKLSGFDSPQEMAAAQRAQEERKIQVPVEAAKASGMNALDRLLVQGTLSGQRADAANANRVDVANIGNQGRNDRAANSVPASTLESLRKAKGEGTSMFDPLKRTLGIQTGTDHVKAALQNVLQETGALPTVTKAANALRSVTGNTLDERIANFPGADFSGMDANERQFLQLELGIK